MKYVNEASTFSVRARFTGANGSAQTPSTVRYKIVDVDNSRTVRDWTSLTPSSTVSFTVAASDNEIFSDVRGNRKKIEHRVLVIQANANLDDQFTDEESYAIRNLKGFQS